jgi:tripartite-type tricarboxylate transporter receptor subunit TctC
MTDPIYAPGTVALALTLCLAPLAASAQSVEQFYRGKTLDVIVGYPTGGSNDIYTRAVAHYIGKFIPGNPSAVMRNLPGAGSLLAANHIYNVAPRDGTVLGLVAATIPLDEKLGTSGVKFEAAKFTWVGRLASGVNVMATWPTAPVKTSADAFIKEASLGATGTSSTVFIYPNVLNNVLGTKFKLVMGYTGSSESMIAMERGEVDGHSTSWEAWKTSHPDWIKEKKLNYIVQFGLTRLADLPDVPTVIELAKTPEQVQILRTVMNATEIGKAILASPNMPKERVDALRHAFDEMVKDRGFIEELQAARVELDPESGEQLQKLVEEVGQMSPSLLEKVKSVYGHSDN